MTQQAIDQFRKDDYEQEVNTYFKELLAGTAPRDPAALQTHLDEINDALERDLEGTIQLEYGGSVKKRTYVDGLSDVDLLAILKDPSLAELSPDQIRSYFAKRLEEHFSRTPISVGDLAVTIKFSDGMTIQILPALKTATGTRIPKAKDGWSNVIKPEVFAQELRAVDKERGGRVVPVIKLFKALNEDLPDDARLTGYHIEALAIDAFKDYAGKTDAKDMLIHLSESASEKILKPLSDSTGQSRNVDDYLGPPNSIEREKASFVLKRIANKMKTADSRASTNEWTTLFGE
jgi:hypothetical protein